MKLFALLLSAGVMAGQGELVIPASTAYLHPSPEKGARVTEGGITRWDDRNTQVLWFGEFARTGLVDCAVSVKLPAAQGGRYRLSLGAVSREASAKAGETSQARVEFGSFAIMATGYQRFVLESLNPSGQPAGEVVSLHVAGAAAEGAHFNLKPRRNAASVHLAYPVPAETKAAAFYCEATGIEEPTATFYMACGWHRGYFGMQVNSPTERRIIFSVWDSGNEAVDRGKVAEENRVRLMAKGEGVYAGDFGNEGTGGHSHLKYLWKTGEKQRFLVTATPTNETYTVFAGYYFHPDQNRWVLISSWKAPKEGGYLRGLHSFSENFWGSNGHMPRKALFGNQWIMTAAGEWKELTVASFSHDPTGRGDRRDRFMGLEGNQFFLSHGGFIPGYTHFGEKFTRQPNQSCPGDLKVPPPGF